MVKRDKNGKWRVAKSEGEFWDDEEFIVEIDSSVKKHRHLILLRMFVNLMNGMTKKQAVLLTNLAVWAVVHVLMVKQN